MLGVPVTNTAHTTSHMLGTVFSKQYLSLVMLTIILFFYYCICVLSGASFKSRGKGTQVETQGISLFCYPKTQYITCQHAQMLSVQQIFCHYKALRCSYLSCTSDARRKRMFLWVLSCTKPYTARTLGSMNTVAYSNSVNKWCSSSQKQRKIATQHTQNKIPFLRIWQLNFH